MAKSAAKALSFWAYLTLAVSIAALLSSSFLNLDRRSPFVSLPADLRRHYFAGKIIKVQPADPARPLAQVFAVEDGPRDEAAETVVLLHGLGCSSYSFRRVMKSLAAAGIRAVAVDLPGSGFSDKFEGGGSGNWGGSLGWTFGIFREISDKGVFWAFDQLVETGQIPDVEHSPVEDGGISAEMYGRVVGQVFDAMSLRRPVHLVIHDSAWGAAVNWVSAHPGAVSSVTLVDSSPVELPAFPFRLLETPVVGELLLRSRFMFGWLVKLCCSRSADVQDAAEAYRILLKDDGGKKAVVAAGKGLNYSFDLGEWVASEGVKEVKFQVLWSNNWSDRWIDEGRRVAVAVPQAKFAWHSGGRWPQEDAAEEIAGMITEFVLSLPKSTRQMKEEPLPDRVSNEESGSNHHHHHGNGYDHDHVAGYFNTYGLGQGWGS